MKGLVTIFLFVITFNINAYENNTYNREFFKKLRSNEPNYFIFAKDNHDYSHLEFNLSIQYPLYTFNKPYEFLLIYNGVYDFYLGTRSSSPIISRRQNPGFALHYKNKFSQSRLGWYHESNGQTVDSQEEFLQEDFSQDHVSRGWDYLGFNHYFYLWNTRQELDLRLYCNCQAFGLEDGREDDIFWKDISEQPNINDYDGIRWKIDLVKLPYGLNQFSKTRLEFKSGNREFDALRKISTKFTLYELFGFPFTLFYFNGYGKEISSYHQRDSYIGVGIELN